MWNLMIECVATLLSDECTLNQKKASEVILKYFLIGTSEYYKLIDFIWKYSVPMSREDIVVQKWKKEILSIGKCESCGSTKNLEAHHVLHWSSFPKERVNVENGRCLCHECHTNEHKDELVYWMMKAKKTG